MGRKAARRRRARSGSAGRGRARPQQATEPEQAAEPAAVAPAVVAEEPAPPAADEPVVEDPPRRRRAAALAAARRSPRRVLVAATVLVAVVAVVLVRAQGEEEGLRLDVGEVARMAPDDGVTAGSPAVAAPAGRAGAAPAPAEPRPRKRTARRAAAPERPPAAEGRPATPAPMPTPAPRVVGRAGPPQPGRPLPSPGDGARPEDPPPAPAAVPTATPTPAPARRPRTYAVDRTDVRMSPLNGTGPAETAVARFQPFPSASRPYATYLGQVAGGDAAAFVVTPGTSVLGGRCRPTRRQCGVVTVPAGRHAWIGFSDGMAWRLDVLAVERAQVASRVEARAARTRYSAAGACALHRLNFAAGVPAALGVDLEVAPKAAELTCPAG